MAAESSWQLFSDKLCQVPELGFSLDVSRMNLPEGSYEEMAARMQSAFAFMDSLEAGATANPDEDRMVGHYWLRAPQLAPPTLPAQITDAKRAVIDFANKVRENGKFDQFLLVGIGGSMLGPQFLAEAIGQEGESNGLMPYFIDNIDPAGIDFVLGGLEGRLDRTLVIITSKSGETPETANGLWEVRKAFERAGIDFASHAVAITMEGKKLHKIATSENWLATFPVFDWVGGRTSVCSAVGLLPLALMGIDVLAFLDGAGMMDVVTRRHEVQRNPAAMLALAWYTAGNGKGDRAMVVFPYSDRLALFSKYLQQLTMESLGKEFDLDGKTVHQGLTVFGNKGSTDQHSFVQQLRDGLDNFFVGFISVLESGRGAEDIVKLEDGNTSDDYLHAFLLGTRQALFDKGRQSFLITVDRVDARTVGALIALFERAVGLYAHLININAYHQPGVQAGKDSAKDVLAVQNAVLGVLSKEPMSAAQLAGSAKKSLPDNSQLTPEIVYHILTRLSKNPGRGVRCEQSAVPAEVKFSRE